jgi:hypothetical protein
MTPENIIAQAKPICVVYINPDSIFIGSSTLWEQFNQLREAFEEKHPDYHWLIFPDHSSERVEIKTFYNKDLTEIDYANIVALIEERFAELKKDTTP